ncbi:hypothetical protein G9F32_16510 [Acinetobacter sp. 194]|uniref:hypothetical protein n=1 Tax=Acinetobacter shaoyimingii TaxID=2715164 RepID=UPI00140835BF|nr:hypothetical protein [Acinetobacter shaoyimingii]NHB59595.1 hypothetical protein [Acinetobacter shaoyimingii]
MQDEGCARVVTVEWQEVAQAQEFEAIELNELEKAYLLQPHRFQGHEQRLSTAQHEAQGC